MINVKSFRMMNENMKNFIRKVIVGGEGGVGKTTFLIRYSTERFIQDTKFTAGVSFLSKEEQIQNINFVLYIWDFGGQEEFRHLIESYCNGAHVGLVFFSLNRYKSLIKIPFWIDLMRSKEFDLPLILVGTKADLEDKSNKINKTDIQEIVDKYNLLGYLRTSSKTGEGVKETIEVLLEYIYNDLIINSELD